MFAENTEMDSITQSIESKAQDARRSKKPPLKTQKRAPTNLAEHPRRSMPVTTRGLGDATDMYLAEIGASELLDAEAEAALAREVQQGDPCRLSILLRRAISDSFARLKNLIPRRAFGFLPTPPGGFARRLNAGS